MSRHSLGLSLTVALALGLGSSGRAQEYSQAVKGSYVFPALNVTYVKSGSWEGKLDVYSRACACLGGMKCVQAPRIPKLLQW